MEKENKDVDEKKEVVDEKKEVKEELGILVVNELPKSEIRTGVVSGKKYELVTPEEALTEILREVRELKTGMLGN